MSRRISFSLKTSTAALTRSSVELVSSIASSPFQAILVSVPRKSNRVDSSFAAWFRALSTSWRSILLTTSNDESAIGSVPFLSKLAVCAPGTSSLYSCYPYHTGRLPERPMGADCKSVGLRLPRFESWICHPVQRLLGRDNSFESPGVVTVCHNPCETLRRKVQRLRLRMHIGGHGERL